MNTYIEQTLKKIYHEVSSTTLHHSLFSGACGIALYKILYLKYFENGEYDERTSLDLENIVANSLNDRNPTLCTGKAGINWFFSYLHKSNIITIRQQNAVCHDDKLLMSKSLDYLSIGNYDYLHGALGIAYYILYRKQKYYKNYFKTVFKYLNFLTQNNSEILLFYNFAEEKISPNEISLGLSHGLPSVLKFCIECFRQAISKNASRVLAYKLINFLKTHINSAQSTSCFPQIVTSVVQDSESRLGWCYGDLSTCYILYQAATVFEDDELLTLSLEILKKTTKRKNYKDTQIQDSSICHGYIGVGYIYEKVWLLTKNELFKQTADYWFSKAVSLETYKDGKSKYMKFDIKSKKYVQSLSLLEGSAGFGLCLISHLTGDYSWDYCLMLN